MKKRLCCKFLGTHNYYLHKEVDKFDAKGNIVGTIIISRCTICGKIHNTTVYTEEGYGR